MYFLFKLKDLNFICIALFKNDIRVATHSGKLKGFSSYRKYQGNSGNFQIMKNLRGTQGSFKI